MEQVTLGARKRTLGAKGLAGRLRRQGRIPAIYYGARRESVAIEVDAREMSRLVRQGLDKHIISLQIDGEADDDNKSVIKAMQKDVVKGDILHIDFQHVSMDEKIHVEIPVEIVGEPAGAKSGGILQVVLRSIRIECLPMDLPEKIAVDVSNLDVGQSMQISALSLPNVTILNDPEEVVTTVSVVKEEAEPEPVVAEEGVEEPELAKTKGKKEEEGDEKQAAEEGKGKEDSK